MLLNLVKRWIFSPLELAQSPMVAAWQACAAANGCTPDQVDQVAAHCESFFSSYELPVARQYAQRYDAPFHGAGGALVYCEMDVTHLAAAQQDPRLIIFSSLQDALPQPVLDAHINLIDPAPAATTSTATTTTDASPTPLPATLGELLKALDPLHVKFAAAQ